ncbi:MAG: SBBP repeat-containing protein [Candidatus Latescibacteria bacterium]|nr:SBBP repeat-containing protein [Candidatus Latescibacterota bacterium]
MKFILCLIITLGYSYSQSWIRTYNGPANNYDLASKNTVDRNGNIFVTGYSKGINNSDTNFDYCTIKYNSAGTEQWIRRYNGNDNVDDVALSIATDSTGNCYVTGNINDHQWVDMDIGTIKYSSSGEMLWVARYATQYEDWGSDVVVDRQGNVYVTGHTYVSPESMRSITIKYDSNGVQQWVAIDSITSWTFSIGLDSFNNIYVAGTGYTIIKYNQNGERQWRVNNSMPGSIIKLDVTPRGEVYVTGESVAQSNSNIVTAKYNTFGQEQWRRTFDGPGHGDDRGQSLAIDNQGNVYVTGRAATQSGPYKYYFDIVTIKYTTDGDEQWVRLYDGFGSDDCAYDVKVDADKSVYVCGFSIGNHPPIWDDDAVVVKYDSLGNLLWIDRYNGPTNGWDWFYSLAIGNDGSVYASGYTDRQYPDRDYLTIQYPPYGPGIEEKPALSKIIPDIKISPNPFQNRVRFDILISQYAYKIKIYRVDGRLVKTFNNITSSFIYWDGKDDTGNILPPGVYFVDVTNGYNRLNQRLVIMK